MSDLKLWIEVFFLVQILNFSIERSILLTYLQHLALNILLMLFQHSFNVKTPTDILSITF